jgi:hypothetical protein
MNAEKALKLIKELGIYGLAESDGCPCCHFNIHGIFIDVSCHKSEHTIRVYSHYMFHNPFDLEPIAEEVHRQVGISNPYKIRFCEYSCDHVGGHWEGKHPNSKWMKTQKCCYCSAPRPDEEAYLCEKCLTKSEARSAYPWGVKGEIISSQEQERRMFAPLLEKCEIHVIGEKELREMFQAPKKPN